MRLPLLAALALLGCAGQRPSPPPAPAAVVPAGCLDDLSGPWVHAEHPAWRYLAVDDGGTLTLGARAPPAGDAGWRPRRFRVDAGSADAGLAELERGPPDAGAPEPSAVEVVLTRTPRGFLGETRAELTLPGGQRCPARFPAEVLACADGGLLLRVAPFTLLGDACQPPASPRVPEPVLQHLRRPR